MKIRALLLVAAATGAFALAANASDWPQWRGPQRDGVSKETGLLQAWPTAGPKLLWQVKDLDSGYSTPAVVGDRLYVLNNKGIDDEFVQARDIKDGKQIWSTRLGKVGPNQGPQYPAARSTPTVDGEYLYALGSDGDLVCVKVADGGEVWRSSLRKDYGGQPGWWAYAESPLVDGDLVVCTPGGKDATIVALNKRTGALAWKSAVPGGSEAGYASAIVVEVNGVKQIVQYMKSGLVGIDAKTGKFLWSYEKTAAGAFATIPTPVASQGYVYSSSVGKAGTSGGLVKLTAEKGDASVAQVYMNKGMPSSIGGTVVVGEYLYGTGQRGLMCFEFATGKEKWHDDSGGAGAICYADGRLYVHAENTGEMMLVEATPDAYREKGRFTPPNPLDRGKGSKAWAYPVVANGRLYIRDAGALWCYDVKAEK